MTIILENPPKIDKISLKVITVLSIATSSSAQKRATS
jgi:hypothetical protein